MVRDNGSALGKNVVVLCFVFIQQMLSAVCPCGCGITRTEVEDIRLSQFN